MGRNLACHRFRCQIARTIRLRQLVPSSRSKKETKLTASRLLPQVQPEDAVPTGKIKEETRSAAQAVGIPGGGAPGNSFLGGQRQEGGERKDDLQPLTYQEPNDDSTRTKLARGMHKGDAQRGSAITIRPLLICTQTIRLDSTIGYPRGLGLLIINSKKSRSSHFRLPRPFGEPQQANYRRGECIGSSAKLI